MDKKRFVFLMILLSIAMVVRPKTMTFHLQFERPEIDKIKNIPLIDKLAKIPIVIEKPEYLLKNLNIDGHIEEAFLTFLQYDIYNIFANTYIFSKVVLRKDFKGGQKVFVSTTCSDSLVINKNYNSNTSSSHTYYKYYINLTFLYENSEIFELTYSDSIEIEDLDDKEDDIEDLMLSFAKILNKDLIKNIDKILIIDTVDSEEKLKEIPTSIDSDDIETEEIIIGENTDETPSSDKIDAEEKVKQFPTLIDYNDDIEPDDIIIGFKSRISLELRVGIAHDPTKIKETPSYILNESTMDYYDYNNIGFNINAAVGINLAGVNNLNTIFMPKIFPYLSYSSIKIHSITRLYNDYSNEHDFDSYFSKDMLSYLDFGFNFQGEFFHFNTFSPFLNVGFGFFKGWGEVKLPDTCLTNNMKGITPIIPLSVGAKLSFHKEFDTRDMEYILFNPNSICLTFRTFLNFKTAEFNLLNIGVSYIFHF